MYLLELDIWGGYIVFTLANYLVVQLDGRKMNDDDLVNTLLRFSVSIRISESDFSVVTMQNSSLRLHPKHVTQDPLSRSISSPHFTLVTQRYLQKRYLSAK
jgi:hypothetical protein